MHRLSIRMEPFIKLKKMPKSTTNIRNSENNIKPTFYAKAELFLKQILPYGTKKLVLSNRQLLLALLNFPDYSLGIL